jgi:uncharacterized protein (DUF2132 family)
MTDRDAKDPLHGVTLEAVLTRLVEYYGWERLGRLITIKCFTTDPSIKSSLHFLRRTPWARKKVEDLYVRHIKKGGGRGLTTAVSREIAAPGKDPK